MKSKSKAIAWQEAWDTLQQAKLCEVNAYNELVEELRKVRPHLGIRMTSREIQVLKGVCEDLQNKQIGDRLCISERTIKFHVSSLLAKFSVTDRADLRRLVYANPEMLNMLELPANRNHLFGNIRAIA